MQPKGETQMGSAGKAQKVFTQLVKTIGDTQLINTIGETQMVKHKR